jgi:HK97 family phage prohead protease
MPVTAIEGYASVYGILDSNSRLFMPGAFTGFLEANPGINVPILWCHQESWQTKPIGMTTKLWEDEIGLRFEGELADTTDGRDTAELVRQGAANGVSHHFFNGDGYYTDDFDTVIQSADMDEVSLMAPGRQANFLATAGLAGDFTSPAIEYMQTIEAVKRAMELATAA